MEDKSGDGDGSAGARPKTEKELKKELEKQKKLEKLKAKQDKLELAQAASKDKKEPKGKKKAEKELKVVTYDIPTPKGDKKDTSAPLPDAYSPKFTEAAWYDWWVKEGFFKPEHGGKDISKLPYDQKFVIVIPPPNVTGYLHLGHALGNSIEDCLCRWHRMQGKAVLWVPGCDHAGIATQVVVEKKLKREQNLSRHDLGREAFVQEVWKWKNEKGHQIYDQLCQLGGSYDWDRVAFTMDPKLCTAVSEAFIRLQEKGLIYRSNRLVNWSCALKSAISDIEVDKKDLDGRTYLPVPGYDKKVEFGVLISFAYKVCDSDEEIVVATTRIETMLGDTAVAVHPDDSRYKHLHGKVLQHPFAPDRKLPVITDEYVEKEFGTGAVKITPAHDQNDYDIGKRHNLPFITIFDGNGVVIGDYGEFTGMKRFDARLAVFQTLKDKGLFRDKQSHKMVVPVCSRSKDIIEPLLRPQWYVDTKEMCARSIETVKQGNLEILPDMFVKTWNSWLENPRDWCISRQLWWGHRVPSYFVNIEGQPKITEDTDQHWVSGHSEEEARQKAAKKLGVDASKILLSQDEDVLDTWFSSALYPFSVLGWPEQTDDMKAFYPGTLLETGHDIIFFWVARMVMMGLTLLDDLPFKYVYLHALVRDAHGRKMSKSLGNIVDPLDVASGISLKDLHERLKQYNLDENELERAIKGQKEDFPDGIPECGMDALRFALIAYTSQGRDINLDILRIKGYRNFCNKMWNATKFSLTFFGENFTPYPVSKLSGKESQMDLWILSRLADTIVICNKGFADYNFPAVTSAVYNFWLYNLCDWYLEVLKPVMYGTDEEAKEVSRNVLYTCLDQGLRLLHPLMPYISEELFQRLPRRAESHSPSIVVAPYPEVSEAVPSNKDLESTVTFAQDVVKSIRSLKADYDLPQKTAVEVYVKCSDDEISQKLQSLENVISVMVNASCLKFLVGEAVPHGCVMRTVSALCEVNIMLKGLIDLSKEKSKLEGKCKAKQDQLNKLEETISKPDFKSKVPEAVFKDKTNKVEELKAEIATISSGIESLLRLEDAE